MGLRCLEGWAWDGSQCDWLTGQLGSRRMARGGLLAGLTLLPLDAAARKKGKQRNDIGKRKKKGKDTQRVTTQDSYWRAGACLLREGANVSQCDFSSSMAPEGLDCTCCNASGQPAGSRSDRGQLHSR